MEQEGAFLGVRIILAPSGSDGGGYMGIHIHKILQAVQLRINIFTVYIISQH